MSIAWIKNKDDKQSFKLIQSLGGNIYQLEDLENVDQLIKDLYENQYYKTIIMSNELAGFSEDIIRKYQFNDDIRIIIAPKKSK